MTDQLRVVESYRSFQGTGARMGEEQYFIRLAGCGVACPIRRVCDEPQALDESAGQLIGVDDLLAESKGVECIHLSGGEPLEQRDGVAALATKWPGRIHIQTSGMIAAPPLGSTWISCSPKSTADKLRLESCNELIVVAAPWVTTAMMRAWAERYQRAVRFVVPLWGESTDRAVVLIREANHGWRLAIQAHKFWGMK